MFRAYARAGIFVNLFMAGAASLVLAHIRLRVPRAWGNLLLAGASGFLLFDCWGMVPGFLRMLDTPAVYRWLADQPGDVVIAEYPMMTGDEAAFYEYLFWQRVHGKRMVNGASPDAGKAWELNERVRDFSRPEAVEGLREAGVEFVIVHSKVYEEGPIPGPLKRYYPPYTAELDYDGGKAPSNPLLPVPCATFGSDAVYRLDEASEKIEAPGK